MYRILLSAGDASGDRHAAALVRELRAATPGAEFFGVGGPALAAQGVELVQDLAAHPVMGFDDVLAEIPRHVTALGKLRRQADSLGADLAVLVDYPDFNLRLARLLRSRGIPVLYYIAPQTWAWRERRVAQLATDVTRLAVILPFEEAYFRSKGITAVQYVGHPLVEQCRGARSRNDVRRELGIADAEKLVGVFPGSRRQERRRHLPVFLDAARRMQTKYACKVLVSGPVQCDGVIGFTGSATDALAACDAAIVKSGTVSLEAALMGVPSVIGYRASALGYAVAKPLIKLKWIGLPNLLLDRAVVPEFVQRELADEPVAQAVGELLGDGDARRLQLEAFREIESLLGDTSASRRTCDIALELLRAKRARTHAGALA